MLKKHMAVCLFATAFAAAPVLAQTTPPPPSGGTDRPAATGTGTTSSGSNAMQPGTSSPSTGSSSMQTSQAGGSQGQFLTQMQPNQMMASKLIGTTVVSTNNESIGDINDVILDRNGQVMAVVIGVGGFLGIGEKDVAVPFQSLDFNAQPQMTSSTTGAGSANAPATTGSTATTGNTGTAASTNASRDNDDGVPDRIVLKMTKAELQAAPAFRTSSRTDDQRNTTGTTGTTGTGTGTGTTTAPRQ